jgi:hypothetical protein
MNMDTFREMAGAMRSSTALGIILKFHKGGWIAGGNNTMMDDRELIAIVDRLMWGWQRWENRRPTDFRIGFVIDHYKPPKRSELEDSDTARWEPVWLLPMADEKTGEIFVFSTKSQGGKDVLAQLQEDFADHREANPQSDLMPRVALKADSYPHPQFGRVDIPIMPIVDWVTMPDNPKIAKIRPPAPSLITDASPNRDNAADDITPPASALRVRDDFDDSIPF